jgi:exodeoxyribonuclease VII small subunit
MTHRLDSLSFEEALSQLQDVVSRLESANLSLDQTIDDFRRGTELAAYCQQLIADAELKVTELVSTRS